MADSVNPLPKQEELSPDARPRAIIHKKILDEAEANPDASITTIARAVGGASADLVERALDNYGDPATANNDNESEDKKAAQNPDLTSEKTEVKGQGNNLLESQVPPLESLTDKQRQTLRAIYQEPEATQVELAEKLNVTNATICTRVNNIEGFDWNRREEFVNTMYNDKMTNGDGRAQDLERESPPLQASREEIETVTNRICVLEQLAGSQAFGVSTGVDEDLIAKIIVACVNSEFLSDDEKLEIVKIFIENAHTDSDCS